MIYSSIEASSVLAPFIKSIWTIESAAEERGNSYRFLPDGFVELCFHLKSVWSFSINGEEKLANEKAKFLGQFSRSLDITLPKQSKMVFIKLYPWVAYRLFGIPLSEFTNNPLPLSELFPDEFEKLHEQLFQCKSMEEIKIHVEKWFVTRLKSLKDSNKEIEQLTTILMQSNGLVQINYLEKNYSRSLRSLQKKFKELIGVSPKHFARIRRVYQAGLVIKGKEMLNYTKMANELGYFDQAHFIHDFKYFTNCSPKQYAKQINPNKDFNNFLIDNQI